MYNGIANLGIGEFCAVYSATEELSDGFCRGVQYFFSKNYHKNLIRMAATVNCFNHNGKRILEYGNLAYNSEQVPKVMKVVKEDTEYIYDVFTTYETANKVTRTSKAYSLDNSLVMEEVVENYGLEAIEFQQYAYVFFNYVDTEGSIIYNQSAKCGIWSNQSIAQKLVIGLQDVDIDTINMSKEAKATSVITLQKILKNSDSDFSELKGNNGLSLALGKKCVLQPKQKRIFKWYIIPCSEERLGISILEKLRSSDTRSKAQSLHDNFFYRGNVKEFNDELLRKAYFKNLLAIKAVTIDGFVPADIVGHYYSGLGTPTTYVRDSLMVAKAFLKAGYYEECKSIIKYIKERPRKNKGEFYQRYDAYGNPSEGLNNDVDHQLDSLGYYLSIIYQYYKETGEMLTTIEDITDVLECIKRNQTYLGLIGPEGGVNEGVYGQAYIVSTNMFIAGGLYHIKEFLKLVTSKAIYKSENEVNRLTFDIDATVKKIEEGIASMWNSEKYYYNYGYSATSECIVERYDTPQYFSVLFGYPNTEKMKLNNKCLLEKARFFEEGIGYSQQSYHNGPWLFNTAACAQYNLIDGNDEEYSKKLLWILEHLNNFYLAPEAIHAEDENVCFNNPLTWACAEVVATIALKGF